MSHLTKESFFISVMPKDLFFLLSFTKWYIVSQQKKKHTLVRAWNEAQHKENLRERFNSSPGNSQIFEFQNDILYWHLPFLCAIYFPLVRKECKSQKEYNWLSTILLLWFNILILWFKRIFPVTLTLGWFTLQILHIYIALQHRNNYCIEKFY